MTKEDATEIVQKHAHFTLETVVEALCVLAT